jgi:hypothetical protein
MIDESGLVPADAGIDHRVPIDGEKQNVRVLGSLVVVTPVGFDVTDSFAHVFDDPRSNRNRTRSECAASMDR